MHQPSSRFVIALLVVSASALAAAQGTALKLAAPPGWVSKTPSSTMRIAEFTLPKTGSDTEDATVTVFFFGGQGGNVQANIDRWIGQIAQPDGRNSKDLAKTTSFQTTSGLKVTMLDVSGTYVAEVSPGSTEKFNKPGFRQVAAYIDTPGGPYFAKLLGPASTVAKWYDSYVAYLKTATASTSGTTGTSGTAGTTGTSGPR
jgi:hypothetical protein